MSPRRVADDERVAVEDLHQVIGHCDAPFRTVLPRLGRSAARVGGGLGRMRWNAMSRSMSPSTTNAPRSTAAIAFSRPDASLSNSGLGARSDTVGGARLVRDGDVALAYVDAPALDGAVLG